MARNVSVSAAVIAALETTDAFLSGKPVRLPPPDVRHAIDQMLTQQRGSVRAAALFLLFYAMVDPGWDFHSVPVGIRGQHGDKKLSDELTRRNLTLHGQTTAFGENLGWKGNVREVDLRRDARFAFLAAIQTANRAGREAAANYLAYRFAESRVVPSVLPDVGADVLTFARAKLLFSTLVAVPSEGHIPQFVVAALLSVHRARYGHEIVTHHPHAADRFDNTAGDIEERRDGHLLRAYEVTVRPDWQNRLSGFKHKMDRFGLEKYVIIASDINESSEWAAPASVIARLEPIGRDIAIIDIQDFINVFSAELTARELRSAVNEAHAYILNPKLCGRHDVGEAYAAAVSGWLDRI